MSKFDPLPISGEHHSVIAHNITTPQGMHSNLGWGALTGNSDPAMRDVTVVGSCGFLVQDLEEASGGSRWGINLVPMVHFGHLDIEMIVTKDAGGASREPEEGVDSDREIGSTNDRNVL